MSNSSRFIDTEATMSVLRPSVKVAVQDVSNYDENTPKEALISLHLSTIQPGFETVEHANDRGDMNIRSYDLHADAGIFFIQKGLIDSLRIKVGDRFSILHEGQMITRVMRT